MHENLGTDDGASATLLPINLLDVLVTMAGTGRLGPVSVGAGLDAVTAVLGAPQDLGPTSRRRAWPRRFAYGDLELLVCRCRRVNLFSFPTWRDTIALPAPSVNGEPFSSPGAPSRANVLAALDEASCPWEPAPPFTLPGQSTLRVAPTNAAFTFMDAGHDDFILYSMCLPGDGHGCPPPGTRP
ncbi:hypothetical protein [Streptomyces sp. NPDC016845]|uniref:hypothetical protein n=1 Tax=Streptomyces sp. NPDC016845 TaxID=3364972 RepID=UPI003790C116